MNPGYANRLELIIIVTDPDLICQVMFFQKTLKIIYIMTTFFTTSMRLDDKTFEIKFNKSRILETLITPLQDMNIPKFTF
jgi:hypothetical protein